MFVHPQSEPAGLTQSLTSYSFIGFFNTAITWTITMVIMVTSIISIRDFDNPENINQMPKYLSSFFFIT
jgi:hypothetical protein